MMGDIPNCYDVATIPVTRRPGGQRQVDGGADEMREFSAVLVAALSFRRGPDTRQL